MDKEPYGVLFRFQDLPAAVPPKVRLLALPHTPGWGWATWADPACDDLLDPFAALCSQKGGTTLVLDLGEMGRHAKVFTCGVEQFYFGSAQELWLVGEPGDPNRLALDKYGLEAALDEDPEQEYELLVSAIDLALGKMDINLNSDRLRAAIAAAKR